MWKWLALSPPGMLFPARPGQVTVAILLLPTCLDTDETVWLSHLSVSALERLWWLLAAHRQPPPQPRLVAGGAGWAGYLQAAGKACRGSESVRVGRRALAYQTSWRFWKRKKLLSQQTSTLCSDFCFSCVIAGNGRGWRASSLDTWPHLRFCIIQLPCFIL